MIFFELMHQSCTATVQRTEHVVSMLKFVRYLMDSASAQEPFLYAGLLQLPQTKMRNATFPPEKMLKHENGAKPHFQTDIFFLLECKSTLTHNPHPLLSAGLEALENRVPLVLSRALMVTREERIPPYTASLHTGCNRSLRWLSARLWMPTM